MRQADLSLPLGIVIRRTPSASRWARWEWRVVSVLPGAPPAEWKELRRDGEVVEFHVATVPLDLWRTDTEGYRMALSARTPRVAVVLREPETGPHPYEVAAVTVSAYEAQDYADTSEDIVELVPMPPELVAIVQDFIDRHHHDETFVKRKRDRVKTDRREDGVGDARARPDDVYRAPRRRAVS